MASVLEKTASISDVSSPPGWGPLIKRCRARSPEDKLFAGARKLDSSDSLSRSDDLEVVCGEHMMSTEYGSEITKQEHTMEAGVNNSTSTDICTYFSIGQASKMPPGPRSP